MYSTPIVIIQYNFQSSQIYKFNFFNCIIKKTYLIFITEPSTEIIGAPDLYIESGSTINLTCVVLNSPEPPAYIYWNHNNAVSIKKSIKFLKLLYPI